MSSPSSLRTARAAAAPARPGGVRPAATGRARLALAPRLPRWGRRAPRMPFVVLVSVIAVSGIVGLLLFNTSMQQAAFTATQLEDRAADLSARSEELALALEDLRDPQRIAEQACRAGMVMGPTAAFLDVDTGRVIGVPEPAVRGACGLTAPTPAPPTRPAPPAPAPAAQPRGVDVASPLRFGAGRGVAR